MTIKRFAARRDGNDLPLAKLARQLGAHLWRLDQPCDYLLLWHGVWKPIELKLPGKPLRGKRQKDFHAEALAAGGHVIVWRTENDVLQTLGAQ